MHKNKILIAGLAGIILGIIFVFFPRQNTPYTGNISRDMWPLCLGSNYYNYNNGVKKTGFPLVDRTTYIGPCTASVNRVITKESVTDFILGFIAGSVLFSGITAITSRKVNGRT